MSDFLSNFDKGKYDELLDQKAKEKKQKTTPNKTVYQELKTKQNSSAKKEPVKFQETITRTEAEKKRKRVKQLPEKKADTEASETDIAPKATSLVTDTNGNFLDLTDPELVIDAAIEPTRASRFDEEETEIDPTFAKKKQMKVMIQAGAVVATILILIGGYFLMNRVTVPNFVGKPISEARTWAIKNKVELEIEEVFDIKNETNAVMEQAIAAQKKMQKGQTLKLRMSKGPDMEETLKLPDFTKMKGPDIEKWVDEQKATNVKVLKEFNEQEEKNKFLRTEFKDPMVSADTYRRKDTAVVYISKGKEVFEKNIAVPDFSKKMQTEVETWGKTNGVEIIVEEVDSDTIQQGSVISQSVAANEKVSKQDKITIQVSLGKAAVVPWFGSMTKEEAQSYVTGGLQVVVRESHHESVPYGNYISQSVGDGARLTGEDKQVIVTYSAGRPYVQDLTQLLEKDLASYFYDFQSKGADITYSTYYERNDAPRGTVLRASHNSQFVGLSDHVNIWVSSGP